MSSSADMTIWLREQIEADRYRAYHQAGCPAHPDQWIGGPFGPCECDSRHVAADCDAKLAILDDYASTVRLRDEAAERIRTAGNQPAAEDLDTWDRAQREISVMEHWVRLLAQGYRHRRGYRGEWRPA